MKIIRTATELRGIVREWKGDGATIGLVPTMGFFHEGHLSLMREARKRADKVITTLFVNPMQFGPNEDLDAYPRDFERDRALAEAEKVDVLFCPSEQEVYGPNFQTSISVKKLSQGLCGADRPGHFDGVATVVSKLFNMTKADIAVFGQKDYQQLALIRQMVDDLNFDIEIIGHPIVRESDGLAMSSRNKYLDKVERELATCLYEAICEAKRMVKAGNGSVPSDQIKAMAEKKITANGQCSVEYASIVNGRTLEPVKVADETCVLALAMKVNKKVRLIDNSLLTDKS